MRRLPSGLVFVLALVCLGALALADLYVIQDSDRTGSDYADVEAGPERAVFAKSVAMAPGDRLLVQPDLMLAPFQTVRTYDFHVVKGGDRYALLEGRTPSPVYASVTGLSAQGCCRSGDLVFVRPDDEAARRPPTPLVEGGPDVTERQLLEAALAQPERIDLVWVLHYQPSVSVPEEGPERERFESRLHADLTHPGLRREPTVFREQAALLRPPIHVGMILSALVAAGAAASWVVRLRRSAQPEPEPGTEGLLRLHQTAGAFLATVRDLLVGSFVALLLIALHVALAGEPSELYHLATRAGLAAGLGSALDGALWLLYLVVFATWVVTLWNVQRALARWRRRIGTQPIEL